MAHNVTNKVFANDQYQVFAYRGSENLTVTERIEKRVRETWEGHEYGEKHFSFARGKLVWDFGVFDVCGYAYFTYAGFGLHIFGSSELRNSFCKFNSVCITRKLVLMRVPLVAAPPFEGRVLS